MIVTKFHENRLTIDREIGEKHAILVDHFKCDFGPGTGRLCIVYNFSINLVLVL